MTDPLWRLTGVRLGSPSLRLLVDALEIPAAPTAVIGPSGAGKTSLLNLLVEFEQPEEGAVEFHAPAGDLPLFWMPADGGLWPHLNVIEHLEAVAPSRASFAELQAHLDRFQLWELRKSRPETLSMGERSRLSVVRGLVAQPRVLVLDEPLAHVDGRLASFCWEAVRDICQKSGTQLVFATHVPETVLAEAEHVICLDRGRLVWSGSVEELYRSPPSRDVAEFLGPANWFAPLEATEWLGQTSPEPFCLRPEHLEVRPDAAGPLEVLQTSFRGSLEEVVVRNGTAESKRLYHRPAEPRLKPGMTVALRALAAMFALLLPLWLCGCNESEGAPVLDVVPVSHRPLPPEGVILPAPRGMTFSPEGELYVLDNAGRVLVYNDRQEVVRQWWMPEYEVGKPERACVLRDGRIAIADTHYHRVVFFSKEGEVLGMLGEFGKGPGQFIYTVAVAQDTEGYLYVAEYGGHDRVQKFTSEGDYVLEFGRAGTAPGEFQRPSGMFWHEGIIYIADAINNRIQMFRDDGTFVGVLADAETAGLHYPYDLALAPDKTIYIAEYGAGRISRISLDGKLLGQFGHEGRRLGEFWTPWGIAVSPQGRIAVADTGNRRIVELEAGE